ncbi:hypothetical protein B0H99_10336 [Planomicrobium soli]|uniref:Uncharacterized protein n=1 Tax=Planomicrobium soli TaxID=1176648 RepID=A0A2P8H3W3_9BACL|nr:hypothetical protein [Planomicrobium soli]PSL40904.1 hypothetical protein B0H99_10336 [Planomicrobium soli]
MERKETRPSYIYMVIASVSMALLGFKLLEYLMLAGGTITPNFLLIFASFFILVHYIYHLEQKAGVSNKVILIQSLLLALSIFFLMHIFTNY